MVAGKALFFVVLSAVFSSVLAGHLGGSLHMKHRALNRDMSLSARAPFVSPRALHRRCKPRYTHSEEPAPSPTPEPEPEPTPEEPEEHHDDGDNGGQGGGQGGGGGGGQSGGGGGGGGGGGYYSGDRHGEATFYSTGLGACGIVNVDSDFICAVSIPLFDGYPGANGNPNQNPVCGRRLRAFIDGKPVELTVTDRCEGCAPNDIDLSPVAFNSVADPARGRVPVTWSWI